MARYIIDIDGVIAEEDGSLPDVYLNARPIQKNIDKVNKLKEQGNMIMLYSSRQWGLYDLTRRWLKKNRVKYDALILGKPSGDYYIDDKAINVKEFEKYGL